LPITLPRMACRNFRTDEGRASAVRIWGEAGKLPLPEVIEGES
jgi:hypothetical protein